jgi:uncharacterized protein (TIGR00255 family)
MIRSMTGFGSASGGSGLTRITVEIRTVNHRFFNPAIKIPQTLQRWEGELRDRMRARISRGHATLLVRFEYDRSDAVAINDELFAFYLDKLRELGSRHSLPAPDLSNVLRMPGIISSTNADDAAVDDPTEVLALVDAALDAHDLMRSAEGARMRDYMLSRLSIFGDATARIGTRAPVRLQEQFARTHAAVTALLAGLNADEQRIAQEIAILADRMDIAEELARLDSHLSAFRAALDDTSGEAVGKRLGFVLQEMLREVNTIGSKGADAIILRDVVILKEELERMREQAENLE